MEPPRHNPKPESRPTLRIHVVILLLGGAVLAAAAPSPYSGHQTREIKALSSNDIADLVAGRGMGLAKAGELNGYPGPAHVLELSDQLGLTAEQRSAIDEIHARMTAAAQPPGADILRRERDLDAQFADVTITQSQLVEETASIAEREGRLRAVHLATHIATRALLTPVQIARYLEIRGYTLTPAHDMHGGTHHHAD
jgi:hypothetical protein